MSRHFIESFKSFCDSPNRSTYEAAYLELVSMTAFWLRRNAQFNRGAIKTVPGTVSAEKAASRQETLALAGDIAQEAWLCLCPILEEKVPGRTRYFDPANPPDLFLRIRRGDSMPALIGFVKMVLRSVSDQVSSEETLLTFKRVSGAVQTRFGALHEREFLDKKRVYYFLRGVVPDYWNPTREEAVFKPLSAFFRANRFTVKPARTKWLFPGLTELIAKFWQAPFVCEVGVSASHMTTLLDGFFGFLPREISFQEQPEDEGGDDDLSPADSIASTEEHARKGSVDFEEEILLEEWLRVSVGEAHARLRANPEGTTRMILAGALEFCRQHSEAARSLRLPSEWIGRMADKPNFGVAAKEFLNLGEVATFEKLKAFYSFCRDRLEDLSGKKAVRKTCNGEEVFEKSNPDVRFHIASLRLVAELFRQFLPVLREYASESLAAESTDSRIPPAKQRARKETSR